MATLLRKCSQLGKLGRIGSTLFPSFPAMLLCILCSEFTGANERETPNLGKNQSRTKWLQIERSSPRCLVVSLSILHVPSNHLQKVRREGTIFNACPPGRHHAICTPLLLFTSYEIGLWKDILRWTIVTLSRCCVQ